MKNLEREVSRVLNHSSALLQELNKARAKQEDSELKDMVEK
jgi:hypothetical protein